MAKLNAKTAKKVDETSGFEPIEDGWYHARLIDVSTDKTGPQGPYWSWEWKVVGPKHEGRRLWNNTTLADGKMFGLKMTFEAFGVPTTTDTDDLCGRIAKLQVGSRVIPTGTRQGEMGNTVDRVTKADPDVAKQFENSPEPESVFG